MKLVSLWVTLGMSLSLVCTGATGLGIGQAIQNGTDATSLVQIADGALEESTNLKTRNGTTTIQGTANSGTSQTSQSIGRSPVPAGQSKTNNSNPESQDILKFEDLFGTIKGKNAAPLLGIADDLPVLR